jgi:hypothetical protein
MARQTAADTMSQVMLSNVIEKLSGNDLNKAVKEAKNYINPIESGNKDVKEGFAGTLGMLYILQALALRVMSDEMNDTSLRQKSEKNIKKALAIAEKQREEDQKYAKKLIEIIQTPEKADRSLIKKFLEVSMAPAKSTRKSASSSNFSFGDWISDFNIVERLITTGVGILACGLGALFIFLMIRLPIGFLSYLFVVPCYLLIYAGLDGWNWLSDYDIATVGGFIKAFCFIILAFTGIGTIAVLYWIGNGTRDRLGF